MNNIEPQLDFDSNYYLEVNRARDAVFQHILPRLVRDLDLRSAVDVGCGIGYYTSYLLSLGIQVTGLDGRIENIDVARLRYAGAKFMVFNIENSSNAIAGRFDLVFCAGLLYHLENPFAAIRNLRAICNSICIIESRVHWSEFPITLLVKESDSPSQSLNRYAMIPSRRCTINMLYASGFDHVYSIEYRSGHEELKRSVLRRPRRHFFVASLAPINMSGLMTEPRAAEHDARNFTPYSRNWKLFLKSVLEAFRWLP